MEGAGPLADDCRTRLWPALSSWGWAITQRMDGGVGEEQRERGDLRDSCLCLNVHLAAAALQQSEYDSQVWSVNGVTADCAQIDP